MLHRRVRSTLLTGVIVLAVSAALIAIVLYVRDVTGVPMGTLTRDPLSGKPAYFGFLSQAGILFWAAGAAAAFLAASALTGAPDASGRRFLFSAGLLTVALCVDDAFLLHDEVLPKLGVPEEILYAVYLGCMLAFLIAFRRHILRTEYPILLLALGFLGLSVICDACGLPWLDPYLLEDGAKVAGIVAWAAYLFRTGGSLIGGQLDGTNR